MSRIAKLPVKLPQGVAATIAADTVTVKGAKGTLSLRLGDGIAVAQQEQALVVSVPEGKATHERVAAAGAARANLVVRDGFAAFYFHTFLDLDLLQETVEGIEAAGYRFVDPRSL